MPGNDVLFTDADLMALLKRYYRDGIESDIYRNSPVLGNPGLNKIKWGGEDYRWAATYASSPTSSYDYTVSADMATKTGKNVQWAATPARQFATLTISQKEIYASSQSEGAFGRILGNKCYLALEGLRKQMPSALYGIRGELYVLPSNQTGTTWNNIPEYVTIALVPGSRLQTRDGNGDLSPIYEVVAVDDTTITWDRDFNEGLAGNALFFAGTLDAADVSHAPVGLGGWILDRTAPGYAARLAQSFFNVVRTPAPAALGGQFYDASAQTGEKYFDTCQKLLRKCRRGGGQPDWVIMNDIDAAQALVQYETMRTQFIGPQEKKASTLKGAESANFVLWTSILDKVLDDPYAPQGQVIELCHDDFAVLHFNNIGKVINDNFGPASANEPGRNNPLADDGANYGEDGDKLIIDDIVSIEDGNKSADGAVKLVGFNLFYQYALLNTASSGRAKLAIA